MAELIKEFRDESERFERQGNDEGCTCMWAAAERLKEELEAHVMECRAQRTAMPANTSFSQN